MQDMPVQLPVQEPVQGVSKTCPYCGYTWTPRVDNPKACPKCVRRFDYKRRRKKSFFHKLADVLDEEIEWD